MNKNLENQSKLLGRFIDKAERNFGSPNPTKLDFITFVWLAEKSLEYQGQSIIQTFFSPNPDPGLLLIN